MSLDRMDSMAEVMHMLFDIVDAVAQVKLSPKAAAATAKARSVMRENQLRQEHEQRQEVVYWK